MINGNEFRLYLDDVILQGETSSGISWSGNTIEVTTKPTGGYAEFIPGYKSGSITFDKLLSFDEVLEIGSAYNFHIGPRTSGYTGRLILESIDISADSDSVVNYSGSAKVTGEITRFEPELEIQFLRARDNEIITTRSGDNIQVRVQIN